MGGLKMAKFDVFVYPSEFSAIPISISIATAQPKMEELEGLKMEQERRTLAARAWTNIYNGAVRDSNKRFMELPAENRTPNAHFNILEEEFKKNDLCYVTIKGLEAGNISEARSIAVTTGFNALVDKCVPEERRNMISLSSCDSIVYPRMESIKIDPQEQEIARFRGHPEITLKVPKKILPIPAPKPLVTLGIRRVPLVEVKPFEPGDISPVNIRPIKELRKRLTK